ncbi:MAG: hypothetical protein N2654_04940 [Deltaproteobacteria bacterium]|nr:hypothetical protein [Deltaproteobacteria bacterium]
MRLVYLLIFFSVVLGDILCKDPRGNVKWYSGNRCPNGFSAINAARLANFKIDAPFPYVVLTGSTSSSMSATGVQYLNIFGSSDPSPSPKSFFNSFKCKSFKIYIETDTNSSCSIGSVRKFMLWNPIGSGSQVGSSFVQIPAGGSGFFNVSVSQDPPVLSIRTEVISGSCPNNAEWTVFCK